MSAITNQPRHDAAIDRVNWRQVGLFVGLTFGLTWLLDLAFYLTAGYRSSAALIALQFQMLIPAFSAILLGLFALPRGAIRASVGQARAFFWFFLVFAVLNAGLAVVALAVDEQSTRVSPTAEVLVPIIAGVAQLLMLLGLIVTVVLRLARGRESFARAGLWFGPARYWLIFGVGFVLFYATQTLLNAAFGFSRPADVTALAAQAGTDPTTLLIVEGILAMFISPFLALLITFGEEYGWRGYLQGELIKLGRVRGVFLVGVIWGLWHAPIILMGHNYPGYPIAGVVLMIVCCVLLGFVLGYAVLKTGSVWLAAFLHSVNNQVVGYLHTMLYTPVDPFFSFGLGIYGLPTLAVVVALILRDPIWRRQEQA